MTRDDYKPVVKGVEVSDTPRTEAARMVFAISTGDPRSTKIPVDGEWCHADFCRQLERELNQALKERDEARNKALEEAVLVCTYHIQDAEKWGHYDTMRTAATIQDLIRALKEKP